MPATGTARKIKIRFSAEIGSGKLAKDTALEPIRKLLDHFKPATFVFS
jgi:hypothetical protein